MANCLPLAARNSTEFVARRNMRGSLRRALLPRIAVILLAAAIVALIGGPLMERASRRASEVMAACDGLLLVTMLGIVALDLAPEIVDTQDWAAAACFVLGVVGPSLMERGHHRALATGRSLFAVAALIGAGVHQLADGSALRMLAAEAGSDRAQVIAFGVAAHQLPVGLAAAWALREQSVRLTIAVFAGLVACTVAGFALTDHVVLSERATLRALALIAGFVLHVLVHDRPATSAAPNRDSARRAEGWGALGGVVLLLVMLHSGRLATNARTTEAVRRFADLLLDIAPTLVFAYAVTGLLAVIAPATSREWLARGSRLAQATKGTFIGLPLPLCSCSVVPLYQRLGAGSGSVVGATAFLIAGPELGLDAVLVSLPLLGSRVTLLRVGCAVIVALVVSLLMGRLLAHRAATPRAESTLPVAAPGPWTARWREGLRIGFVEVLGHTAPWIFAGLAAAAILGPTPAASWLASLPSGWQVVALTLAGVPAYVCASAATPLVAMLAAGGVSTGACLAFLITGPATNVTTFGVMARLHGRRAALAFLVAVCSVSIGLGLVVSALWPDVAPPPISFASPDDRSPVDYVATAILLLATARLLATRGVRSLLAELRPSRGHVHGPHGTHGP